MPDGENDEEDDADKVDEEDLWRLLDYAKYFSLMKLELPQSNIPIIDKLTEEKLILKKGKRYSITNLGAILFAKDLNKFPKISRKKIRIIQKKKSSS